MTDYTYFLYRKSQLYCYRREDVKVLAGWVVTAPQDLVTGQEDDFFRAVYDFLCQRYGGEKICAAKVLNRRELRNFHPDLQRYLKAHGIGGTTHSGITKAQGGNKPVSLLKQ